LLSAEATRTRARFFCGDLFSPLGEEVFDVIVVNPPYIAPAEAPSLSVEVRDYEPHLALFTPDPAALYERIIREAARHLKPDGLLLAELCPALAEDALRAAAAYAEKRILRDLAGAERTLFARL
jgi:release factor glutamine methyltransferase